MTRRHIPAAIACAAGLIFLCCLLSVTPALADPERGKHEHGWQDQRDDDEHDHEYQRDHEHGREHEHEHHHGGHYVGYSGRQWDDDYGIIEGRCNRAAVGAVIGGVIGGVVGSQVGGDRNQPVAMVVGVILGSVIGHEVGRDMDDADRGCIGHALELAHDGQSVHWENERTGVNYIVTPAGRWRSGGDACREFNVRTSYGDRSRVTRGHACRSGDGVWRMR